MRVNVVQDGRTKISSMPRRKEGEPLIQPSGTYEFTVKLATRSATTADGYTPVLLPNQTIEIATAVFDDASFEGEAEPAISFVAAQMGRKRHLTKVLALFQASAASRPASATTIVSLKAAVSSLPLEADSASVQEVLARFPNTSEPRLQMAIEVGMKGARDDVLNSIVEFQIHHRQAEANEIQEWLTATTERYRAWLARL